MKTETNIFMHPDFIDGARNALPIFIGYFTTSAAFGILALSSGLTPFEAVVFSMTNLTGAAQFMAINLMASGVLAGEIVISVFLMNLRYFVMSASLARKLGLQKKIDKAVISFGVTDEVFTVASLKPGEVSTSFMRGLQYTSWLGWTGGTIAGVTMGAFFPRSLQDAMSGSLFALFAALLVPEIKKGYRAAILAVSAGLMNTVLYYVCHISAGWSIVISMLAVTAVAAALFSDDDTSGAEIQEEACR
ncbi:MAG TPA: AzlC family ABC transporter permease [Spirochaetota bacterium]|nr:AzlC family ABC transporter permease [Spirochaetota bacterium]